MLQIHDIRESRVYQEAKEEGLKEGFENGIAIVSLAGKKSAAEIAVILELDVELVRQALAQIDAKRGK
jgi:predicted transposase YdaD